MNTKVQMTANQLIVLLQVYRGTLANEMQCGTFQNDLNHLVAEGFLKKVQVPASRTHPTFGYDTTTLATAWIKSYLLGER